MFLLVCCKVHSTKDVRLQQNHKVKPDKKLNVLNSNGTKSVFKSSSWFLVFGSLFVKEMFTVPQVSEVKDVIFFFSGVSPPFFDKPILTSL